MKFFAKYKLLVHDGTGAVVAHITFATEFSCNSIPRVGEKMPMPHLVDEEIWWAVYSAISPSDNAIVKDVENGDVPQVFQDEGHRRFTLPRVIFQTLEVEGRMLGHMDRTSTERYAEKLADVLKKQKDRCVCVTLRKC